MKHTAAALVWVISPHRTMVHEYDTQDRQHYTPHFCMGVGALAWFHGVALRYAWSGYNTVSSVEETAVVPLSKNLQVIKINVSDCLRSSSNAHIGHSK